MSTGGNPFHGQWNPRQASVPMPVGSTGGNPFQNLWNKASREIPSQPSMSYYGSQSMMSQQAQYLNVGQGHGFYQNPSQQPNFSRQPGASQIPSSFTPLHSQQLKLPFMATLHLPNLLRLLNDPICHNPRWPPMPTKLPSDILKF